MSKKERFIRDYFRYAFEFMTAGFVGWVYEVATLWIMYRYYDNRGMLHMPIIPIYALGAFMLLIIFRDKCSPLRIFVFASVITTAFELAASYLLEWIFHVQFWTYSGWAFSILDRSSVISSLIFGLLAVLYFKVIHPLSEKLCNALPLWICAVLAVTATAAVAVDTVISAKELLSVQI